MITEDHLWLKAAHGTTLTQLPRKGSFCAHTIAAQTEPLSVHDASIDPRFSHNPLVSGEPGIRAYTGVALVTPHGHAIGTLCVVDLKPRTLGAEQLRALLKAAQGDPPPSRERGQPDLQVLVPGGSRVARLLLDLGL